MSDFSARFHDDWMEVTDKASGCCWSFVFEHDRRGHAAVSTPFTVMAKEKLPNECLAEAACAFAQRKAAEAGSRSHSDC